MHRYIGPGPLRNQDFRIFALGTLRCRFGVHLVFFLGRALVRLAAASIASESKQVEGEQLSQPALAPLLFWFVLDCGKRPSYSLQRFSLRYSGRLFLFFFERREEVMRISKLLGPDPRCVFYLTKDDNDRRVVVYK